MGVGVMLDVARVLIDRNEPFDNSVIFSEFEVPDARLAPDDPEIDIPGRSADHAVWNGGEETLQDGSHLYSTQHPSAKE